MLWGGRLAASISVDSLFTPVLLKIMLFTLVVVNAALIIVTASTLDNPDRWHLGRLRGSALAGVAIIILLLVNVSAEVMWRAYH